MNILLCGVIPILRYGATKDLKSLICTVNNCGVCDEMIFTATWEMKFNPSITTFRLRKLGPVSIVKLLKRRDASKFVTLIIANTNYYQ